MEDILFSLYPVAWTFGDLVWGIFACWVVLRGSTNDKMNAILWGLFLVLGNPFWRGFM